MVKSFGKMLADIYSRVCGHPIQKAKKNRTKTKPEARIIMKHSMNLNSANQKVSIHAKQFPD